MQTKLSEYHLLTESYALHTNHYRRDLLNFPNHIHKYTNYIYSHPRQQIKHTVPRSHYINNRILYHAIINKLNSHKTNSSFNRTTKNMNFGKLLAMAKLTGFLTQLDIILILINIILINIILINIILINIILINIILINIILINIILINIILINIILILINIILY